MSAVTKVTMAISVTKATNVLLRLLWLPLLLRFRDFLDSVVTFVTMVPIVIYFVVSMVTVLRSLQLFPWSLLLPLLLMVTSVHCMLSLRKYATRVSPCRDSIHLNIIYSTSVHYMDISTSALVVHSSTENTECTLTI
jgi:hypothetical protein